MKAHILLFCFFLAFLPACFGEEEPELFDYICVCNRGNQSTSIINVATDQVVRVIYHTKEYSDLYVNASIPMYCNYFENENGKLLSVGDRGNWAIWFFDTENDFELVASMPAGEGIFHHWVNTDANQCWIVCDGVRSEPSDWSPLRDSEVAVWVYDLTTYQLLGQIFFPADLTTIAIGSKATFHDVVVSPTADFAIVTTYNFPSINDFAIKYSTVAPFDELGRAPVGTKAHVTYEEIDRPIYVISQSSLLASISLIRAEDMHVEGVVAGLDGAHMMVGPGVDGHSYFVTNLPGAGFDGLFVFNAELAAVDYATTTDTAYSVPHNVALSHTREKLYLTHSGTNVVVTVWDVSNIHNPKPIFLRTITTGTNPYGIFDFQSEIKIGDSSSQPSAASQNVAAFLLSFLPLFIYSLF